LASRTTKKFKCDLNQVAFFLLASAAIDSASSSCSLVPLKYILIFFLYDGRQKLLAYQNIVSDEFVQAETFGVHQSVESVFNHLQQKNCEFFSK